MGEVVLLNGAFGVGKSSVARYIVRTHRDFALYDPERIGFVLRRLPSWIPASTRAFTDYQDAPLWRRLVAAGVNRRARGSVRTILMPMCMVNAKYIAELRASIESSGSQWREICLVADPEVVYARLAARGLNVQDEGARWVRSGAAAAIAAHASGGYGRTIATDGLAIPAVAELVLSALGRRGTGT